MEPSLRDILLLIASHIVIFIYIFSFLYCRCTEFKRRKNYGVTFKVVLTPIVLYACWFIYSNAAWIFA